MNFRTTDVKLNATKKNVTQLSTIEAKTSHHASNQPKKFCINVDNRTCPEPCLDLYLCSREREKKLLYLNKIHQVSKVSGVFVFRVLRTSNTRENERRERKRGNKRERGEKYISINVCALTEFSSPFAIPYVH